MSWITEFANRAILMERGRIVADGKPDEVVALHMEHSERRKTIRSEALEEMKSGRRRPGRRKEIAADDADASDRRMVSATREKPRQ